MHQNAILRLRVHEGERELRNVAFDNPRVTIGKAADNTLVLTSAYLSRHHGEFTRDGGTWSYRDLGSTNGTKVRRHGREIRLKGMTGSQQITLEGGERLTVGNLGIDVRLEMANRVSSQEHVVHSKSSFHQALTLLDGRSEGSSVLRLLFDTLREVGGCNEPKAVLEAAARGAFRGIPELTHILLLEKDPLNGEQWVKRWAASRSGAPDEEPFSLTLLKEVLERGESLHYSTRRDQHLMSDSIHRARINWSICVPLRGMQGYLGVLQADCREGGFQHRERDLHFMTLLGDQVAAVLDRMNTTQRIQQMFEGFVAASVSAIESRDPCTAGHSARVAKYSLDVAAAIDGMTRGHYADIQFSDAQLQTIRYAALLHDFGKVGVREGVLLKSHKFDQQQMTALAGRFTAAHIELRAIAAERKVEAFLKGDQDPAIAIAAAEQWQREEQQRLETERDWLDSILGNRRIWDEDASRLERLTEPVGGVQLLEPQEVEALLSCRGTLTREERLHIETHAEQTRCYLERIPWSDDLGRVPEIAGAHHEKMNGKGYPSGLVASELAIETRILTVCDIYDALTAADRPYRQAMTYDEAITILNKDVDAGAVDPRVLEVLEEVVEKGEEVTEPG